MPIDYPYWGVGDVASYQMSGVPFVTSSAANEVGDTPVVVKFPSVTRHVTIRNTDGSHAIRVGFTPNGVTAKGGSVSGSDSETGASHKNYFVIAADKTTPRLEIRCKQLFFAKDGGNSTEASFTIMAGLTPIPERNFPLLSGSEGYLGIG
tara:strand:- start:204 stop:653 length:450 start_codon:yes stop_codon:yes gene_type:complete